MATAKQIEAARKALADGHGIGAAIDAAELAVWQPIETAPKNIRILVTDGKHIAVSRFPFNYYIIINEMLDSFGTLTGWRPLPAPPKNG